MDREQARTPECQSVTYFGTLQALFGSLYVSQFNLYSQVWQVIVQAAPEYRSCPDDIKQVYVRSTNGGRRRWRRSPSWNTPVPRI
ncbi:MAG: efflux RND transporter permease subunit [Candidatus Competibacteraceae bacterium]